MNGSNGSNGSSEEGNTITSHAEKQKRISPAKRWCFTLNNYTELEIGSMVPIIKDKCCKAIISKEIGESGTPHLQGFIKFKTKARPIGVFGNPNIHFEKCKGSDEDNYNYCSKDGDIILVVGFKPKPTTISRQDFYPWQESLVAILEKSCPWDDRTIYWRYGDINIGKTQFAKWCCVHLNAVVIGGHSKHMLAQVQKQYAPIYIILLSYGDEIISYRAVEQIKDGLFTSNFGCDNNHMEIRDAPHILIIGNNPPDYNDKHFHPTKYDVCEI